MIDRTPEHKCTLTCKQALETVQNVLEEGYLDETKRLWAKRKVLHLLLEAESLPKSVETIWTSILEDTEDEVLAVTRFMLAIQTMLDRP